MIKKEIISEFVLELINKSYPSLKNKKIKIIVLPKFLGFFNPFSAQASYLKILINPKYCFFYNDFEMKGLLAHELIHVEDYFCKGHKWMKKNNRQCRKFCFNRNYERQTDMKVILEKGFGNELLAQRLKRETKKDRNYQNKGCLYLSSNEIKEILSKTNTKLSSV